MNNFGQNEWKSKNQLTFFFLINIIRIVWNVSWGNRIESREKKWVKSFEVFCHSLGKILRPEREREREMDPEQTFIRVQERFSQMVRPKVRAVLEYLYLFIAITLFCILVVMHANYVQQVQKSYQFSIFRVFVVVVVVVEFSISICQFVFFLKLSF